MFINLTIVGEVGTLYMYMLYLMVSLCLFMIVHSFYKITDNKDKTRITKRRFLQ